MPIKSKKILLIAYYSEIPYWVYRISQTDKDELIKKDKPRERLSDGTYMSM